MIISMLVDYHKYKDNKYKSLSTGLIHNKNVISESCCYYTTSISNKFLTTLSPYLLKQG